MTRERERESERERAREEGGTSASEHIYYTMSSVELSCIECVLKGRLRESIFVTLYISIHPPPLFFSGAARHMRAYTCVCTHIMYALYIRTKQRIDALIRLQPLTLCRDTTPFFVCIHTHHPLCVYTHITARPFAHMIQLYRISRFSSRSRTSRSVSHNIVSPPQPYLYKSTPHCNISYTIWGSRTSNIGSGCCSDTTKKTNIQHSEIQYTHKMLNAIMI